MLAMVAKANVWRGLPGNNSPTEALVWPPLTSHGFGGDGLAISPVIVATHRAVIRERMCGVVVRGVQQRMMQRIRSKFGADVERRLAIREGDLRGWPLPGFVGAESQNTTPKHNR
jgi:hypothetical protein